MRVGLVAAALMLLNVSMPPPGTSAKLMSAEQTDLPFTGLKDPNSVAVATNGDVYITDAGHRRVLKLGVGSTQQTELPLVGLSWPEGVAVDAGGSVYVADTMNARIIKFAAG
ncbi:MAG TPA: hypothetical protein VGG53_13025 [Mycobacterium sp.]|uniref:hypothetical protein n=1 Tax=Mycobacterium sp. TaxID=1785 RepID=UPI002F418650